MWRDIYCRIVMELSGKNLLWIPRSGKCLKTLSFFFFSSRLRQAVVVFVKENHNWARVT